VYRRSDDDNFTAETRVSFCFFFFLWEIDSSLVYSFSFINRFDLN
jgi:hypothetical protein